MPLQVRISPTNPSYAPTHACIQTHTTVAFFPLPGSECYGLPVPFQIPISGSYYSNNLIPTARRYLQAIFDEADTLKPSSLNF